MAAQSTPMIYGDLHQSLTLPPANGINQAEDIKK
jgi:hypothetical protein